MQIVYKMEKSVNNNIKNYGGNFMKKNWIIILIIAIIIIGVITGIAIYDKNKKVAEDNNIIENAINEISEKVIDECIDEWNEIEEQAVLDIETNSSEEKTSPNCLVILKRYYKKCNHTINEYIDIPQDLVNKTYNDLEKEYSNWVIKEFSSSQVILYREFDSNCAQHFVVKDDDGKIVIYRLNENNEEEIFQKTEISVEYLTDTDKIEIENGIRVNGMEELNQLIEDFE